MISELAASVAAREAPADARLGPVRSGVQTQGSARSADKIGFDGTTTLTDTAVRALEEYRVRQAAIGQAWVFPAHFKKDKDKPTSRHSFAKWWSAVEAEANITKVARRQFHSLRRKFATEMKHAPLRDLAYLGGWKSVSTVVEVYQRPDTATMQRALAARRPVGVQSSESAQLGTSIRHQTNQNGDASPATAIANEA